MVRRREFQRWMALPDGPRPAPVPRMTLRRCSSRTIQPRRCRTARRGLRCLRRCTVAHPRTSGRLDLDVARGTFASTNPRTVTSSATTARAFRLAPVRSRAGPRRGSSADDRPAAVIRDGLPEVHDRRSCRGRANRLRDRAPWSRRGYDDHFGADLERTEDRQHRGRHTRPAHDGPRVSRSVQVSSVPLTDDCSIAASSRAANAAVIPFMGARIRLLTTNRAPSPSRPCRDARGR